MKSSVTKAVLIVVLILAVLIPSSYGISRLFIPKDEPQKTETPSVTPEIFVMQGSQIKGLTDYGNNLSEISISKLVTGIADGALTTAPRLCKINFEGNLAAWSAVEKTNSGILAGVEVNCTDGTTVTVTGSANARDIDARYLHNKNQTMFLASNGFIENQKLYADWQFGSGTLDSNGCGIVAVYNAMTALDFEIGLAELIRYYEATEGAAMGGLLGTWPNHVLKFNEHIGPDKQIKSYDAEHEMLVAANQMTENQVMILTFWNLRASETFPNITGGAHTVAVTKNANGTFTAHNNNVSTLHDISDAYINGLFWTDVIIELGPGAYIIG